MTIHKTEGRPKTNAGAEAPPQKPAVPIYHSEQFKTVPAGLEDWVRPRGSLLAHPLLRDRKVPCAKCGKPTAAIICEWREAVCDQCWKGMK